jgi:hypothetical protein
MSIIIPPFWDACNSLFREKKDYKCGAVFGDRIVTCVCTFCLQGNGVFGTVVGHDCTRRILPPATSFCSPESRAHSAGSILTTLTSLKVIRQ